MLNSSLKVQYTIDTNDPSHKNLVDNIEEFLPKLFFGVTQVDSYFTSLKKAISRLWFGRPAQDDNIDQIRGAFLSTSLQNLRTSNKSIRLILSVKT